MEIVNITSRAWAFPILSALHDGVPFRQAKLISATGAGRTAFGESLAHLVEMGLVERNPGHGHPLRPEFRLTPSGKRAAKLANEVLSCVKVNDRKVLRRRWTVPILATLDKPKYFNEIRKALPGLTDRALSQALKSMEETGWVNRKIIETARPPKVAYSLMGIGKALGRVLNASDGSI